MNWIQKHALRVLIRHAEASLKEMRPDGVEANLFSYHIHYLKSHQIIESVRRGQYRLTTKGMRIAGKLSSDTGSEAEDVKTVVVLYATRGDEVLLFQWTRHPYLGYHSLPHDRYNYGTSLHATIEEALKDKLHISGEHAHSEYLKSGMIHVIHEGEQVSCMSAHVYRIAPEAIVAPLETRNGLITWVHRNELDARDDVMSHVFELVREIEDPSVHIFDVTLTY